MNRTLALLAASTLLGAALASAQPDTGTMRRHEPMQMRQQFVERLGLSDQQMEQVRKLRVEHEKEMTDLHAKIRIARLDLKELLIADKPDRGAIEKKISAISDLEKSGKLKMLDHMFAVRSLLTPEQQKIWKNHMGRFGEEPRGSMQRGGRGRRMLGEGMPWMDRQPGDDPQGITGEDVN